jgi:DNA-binding transcriptional LysR family regulator
VPRLPAFEAAHPDVDVMLEATTRYADFRHEQVDLAIRFGTGPWDGLASEPLLPLEYYPVCKPNRLRSLRRPCGPRPRHMARRGAHPGRVAALAPGRRRPGHRARP